MKKFFAFIAAAFMAISVSAQSDAGSFTLKPNVGFTYTTATGDFGKKFNGGFALTAGVEGMYMVNEKFGAALGVNLTGHNTTWELLDDVVCSNYYFNIPVTANYYVAPGLAIKAGVAFNFLTTAKIDGYDEYDFGIAKLDVKDLYKSNFISIPVGLSYEISDFVFDARYNFGVSKVADANFGLKRVSRSAEASDGSFNAFSFTVGYKF